jgi:LacI family transcriptional regulator
MFCQSNESYEREVKAVETLMASRVDGILVSMSKTTTDYEHFRRIGENEIPLVFFDRICEDIDTGRVIVDDEEGAYRAVSHLILTGCKNIVHLSAPENLLIGRNRRLGYLRALREHNIPVLPENIIKCDTSGEAEAVICELISRPLIPDGIFAVNDLTAAEAMKVLKRYGFKVPDNISIVGFTSGMISDLTDPPLTSIEQHGYTIGREAVKMLIDEIEQRTSGSHQIKVISTELVVKGSTRPL